MKALLKEWEFWVFLLVLLFVIYLVAGAVNRASAAARAAAGVPASIIQALEAPFYAIWSWLTGSSSTSSPATSSPDLGTTLATDNQQATDLLSQFSE